MTNDNKQWTLQDISFHLPSEQVLGLLGHAGSGKTTIARLLLRLYDIQSGLIRLGDVPITQTSLMNLRQHIGLVTQDIQLFQASVRDNLAFFDRNIRDTEILETLESLELMSGCIHSLMGFLIPYWAQTAADSQRDRHSF